MTHNNCKNSILQQLWNSGRSLSTKYSIIKNTQNIQLNAENTNIVEPLSKLDRGKTNVAGSFVLEMNNKLRHITKVNALDKKQRIAIFKWITGGIVRHQPCAICNQQLSRKHAIECSGAGAMLLQNFEFPNYENNYNLIDQLLNKYADGKPAPLKVYNFIAEAIYMIYRKCLNFKQATNGFWVAALDTNGNNAAYRKKKRKQKELTVPAAPVGRPKRARVNDE